MEENLLSTPDLIIAGVILLSILIGVVRGFIKESISLITWIVAICLAIMYASPLSAHISFTKSPLVHTLTAFLLIFVGMVFVGALINYMISSLIRRTPFSIPDKVLGSLFGLMRGIAFVTILVLLGGLTPLPEEGWWQQSYSIARLQVLAVWLKERLPEENAKVFHFADENKKAPV